MTTGILISSCDEKCCSFSLTQKNNGIPGSRRINSHVAPGSYWPRLARNEVSRPRGASSAPFASFFHRLPQRRAGSLRALLNQKNEPVPHVQVEHGQCFALARLGAKTRRRSHASRPGARFVVSMAPERTGQKRAVQMNKERDTMAWCSRRR